MMKRRIWIFDTSQFAPAGSGDPAVWRRIWQSAASNCNLLLAAIVILASLVTIGCALALSNPTVAGSEPEGGGAFEIESPGFSSVQCHPGGNCELSKKYPVTRTSKTTEEGSRLIFPLVLVGEVEPAKKEKIFLPLFTRPRALCANRVVRTGDKLTFNGREIRLIGMNVAYILEEWFPESEWEGILSFLAQSGNTVRIPVFPEHARDLDRVERNLGQMTLRWYPDRGYLLVPASVDFQL